VAQREDRAPHDQRVRDARITKRSGEDGVELGQSIGDVLVHRRSSAQMVSGARCEVFDDEFEAAEDRGVPECRLGLGNDLRPDPVTRENGNAVLVDRRLAGADVPGAPGPPGGAQAPTFSVSAAASMVAWIISTLGTLGFG
jgi:hypothetical protein